MLEASEILNASILIVDDQEPNVMLVERILRNAGYTRITSTMDPRAVCPLHATHRYDLILLDLQMPEMDGFQVMEGLKEIEAGGYLPVLVITAQPGHKLRALQAGAKDFVTKPFDMVEVQTRIHNMLEVRLLYQKLESYNKVLEQTVQARTAELRESEARFKSFTELSSDWYWEQDSQGKFTKLSGPVLEMLGIDTSDGAGATGTALAAGWNADERALLDANIAARRPFLDFVYSRVNADGTKQYFQASGEPMFDSASRFIGYRGIGMDITDRMRPSQEQIRFRRAIDIIDQGVCLLDRASMRVVDANETACRMSGYSRHELFLMDPADFGFGSGAHLAILFDALVAGGPVHGQAASLRRKDGSTLATVIDWHLLPMAGSSIIVGVISPSTGPIIQ
ncbi:MAG: putative sensor protein [Herminiimonas sp.]|nr:putative sensor protein [Herminiimonas sp.]